MHSGRSSGEWPELERRFAAGLVALICLLGRTAIAYAEPPRGANPTAEQQGVLTTVAAVRALTLQQAAQGLPVELHATLTYYEPGEGLTFVQDASGGVFVFPLAHPPALRAGDEVILSGVTSGNGFTPNVQPSAVRLEKPGSFPDPVPATWRDLMHSADDSVYVRLTGRVRSATVQFDTERGAPAGNSWDAEDWVNGYRRYILLDLETDGGTVLVHMEHAAKVDPLALLDSEVTIDGVAGGIFDGKYQQIGAELWVSSAEHMHIVRPGPGDATRLPITPISRVMTGYSGQDLSERVHVRGSVTLYQPGLQMVLETTAGQAVLVNTYEQSPIQIGQVVDAVGFPDPYGYSEVLTEATVFPTPGRQVIRPAAAGWD